ncbi:MAG: hypothetical protein KAI72_01535 [Candidatus Pacebacteria bacterium]|nr:hypothetical protein [Candidatus Paceibacterota bacterium]
MKKLFFSLVLGIYSLSCFGALVKGTNCGFVTVAPSVDPGGTLATMDGYNVGAKNISSSDATSVIEIGWWKDSGPAGDLNFDVCIYAHDAGDDEPGAVIDSIQEGVSNGAGWFDVSSLSISISGSTTYWIGLQGEPTATITRTNYTTDGGEQYDYNGGGTSTELPSPWGTSTASQGRLITLYAVYTTGAVERRIIMITKYNLKFGVNVLGG